MRKEAAKMRQGSSEYLTWPNFFTLFRLLSIPIFVWVLFGLESTVIAAVILAILGSTDWVDGWLARVFDQKTQFGAVFDPSVDRLLFLVAVPCLIIDGSIPLVVAWLALARELLVVLLAFSTYLFNGAVMEVTWEGKSGAFALMFAFPMFLYASSDAAYNRFFYWFAWFISIPGLGFAYFSLFFQYFPKFLSERRH